MEWEMCDEIHIDGLEVFAHHGVFAKEKEEGQKFVVNAVLYTDLRKAGNTDRLEDSTHYGEVCLLIHRVLTENTYDLIERAAEECVREILLQFPLIREVELELIKPEAPIPLPFESVSVKIKRGWHRAFIALGSNLGDSKGYIEGAVIALKEDRNVLVEKLSDLLVTKPYGGVEQPDFLNGVLEIKTLYHPEELLVNLNELERAAGRERTIHWGPRTLDLDIIFYDKLIYESENLIIPHVDMQHRDFVLKPMVQLAPNFRHPILQKTMQELLEECNA